MWLYCCQRVKADDRLLDLNFKKLGDAEKFIVKESTVYKGLHRVGI